MNENKTNINFLVTFFTTLPRNTYKIRDCEN